MDFASTGKLTLIEKIGAPLRRAADCEPGAADLIGEHLPQHHPHDRTPAQIEEHDVQIGADQRQHADMRRQLQRAVGADRRWQMRPSVTLKVTAMPIEPISSSGLRPMRSMRTMATRHAAIDSVPLKMLIFSESAFAETHRLPQHGAVVEHDVDAHQLLKRGQSDTHPDDAAPAAR